MYKKKKKTWQNLTHFIRRILKVYGFTVIDIRLRIKKLNPVDSYTSILNDKILIVKYINFLICLFERS